MAAAVVDLVNKPFDDLTANRSIELGATYRLTIIWKTGDPATAVNLTGYTARSMFKSTPEKDASRITAITKANPCVVTTAAAHKLKTGQTVVLPGVGGMVELTARYTVTKVSDTSFSLGVDSTAYTTYTSGGTVAYVSLTNVLGADGQLVLGTVNGDVQVYILDTITDQMPPGGTYDVELIAAGGDVTRVVQGVFAASPNTTR